MLLLLSAHFANATTAAMLISPRFLRLVVGPYRGATLIVVGCAYALVVGRLMDGERNAYEGDELAIIEIRRRWRLPTFMYLVLSWLAAAAVLIVRL